MNISIWRRNIKNLEQRDVFLVTVPDISLRSIRAGLKCVNHNIDSSTAKRETFNRIGAASKQAIIRYKFGT
jgi:hypothetical protein